VADSAPSTSELIPIPLTQGRLLLCRQPPIGCADTVLQTLLDNTPWQQLSIKLFGKSHPQPRLEAWYGDPGAHYSYSGIQHTPLPWTPELAQLRQALESFCNARFNSVLLNLYRDGSDSMGLHADDEPELGPHPTIASLSLGAQRRMYFKHKTRKDLIGPSIDLPHGSLLVMAGETQQYWKHGIRKTRKACGARINLTFRLIDHTGA